MIGEPTFYDDKTMVSKVPEIMSRPCLMCGAAARNAIMGPARFDVLNACDEHVERVRGVARGDELQ